MALGVHQTRPDRSVIGRTHPIVDIEKAAASGDTIPTGTVRAIMVGTSGDLKVDVLSGATVTLKAVAGGVWHWMEVTKVYDVTGVTTAVDIFFGK
jgi:hypothetical protein